MSGKTIKAGLWNTSGKLIARALDFALLLIFSRILTPEDFGLVALAMVPIYIGHSLFSLPLVQTLLRIKSPAKYLFDTAFTLSVIRGFAFAVLFLAISIPMARFYNEPRLTALICALALSPIFRGLQSPNLVLFMKTMDFRRIFILDVLARLTGFCVAVTVAKMTGSYWAIAIMPIVSAFAMNLLSYILAPYRPGLTLKGWHEFADMIGWNTVSQILNSTNGQLGRILLGRSIPTDTLGQYTLSEDILSIPHKSFVAPMSSPLMANYAQQSEPTGLVRAYGLTQNSMVTLMTPLYLAISILAAPIIFVVFGEKWMAAAPIMQLLALTWILPMTFATVSPLALTLDKTRYYALLTAIDFSIKIPAMIIGIKYYGIWGAILAIFIGGTVTMFSSFFVVRKLIGLGLGSQFVNLSRPWIAAGFMAFAMWSFRPEIAPDLSGSKLSVLWQGIACGLLGLAVYSAALSILWLVYGRPRGFETMLMKLVEKRTQSK
jgi:O-antigen/teichoic acid export membrane protein